MCPLSSQTARRMRKMSAPRLWELFLPPLLPLFLPRGVCGEGRRGGEERGGGWWEEEEGEVRGEVGGEVGREGEGGGIGGGRGGGERSVCVVCGCVCVCVPIVCPCLSVCVFKGCFADVFRTGELQGWTASTVVSLTAPFHHSCADLRSRKVPQGHVQSRISTQSRARRQTPHYITQHVSASRRVWDAGRHATHEDAGRHENAQRHAHPRISAWSLRRRQTLPQTTTHNPPTPPLASPLFLLLRVVLLGKRRRARALNRRRSAGARDDGKPRAKKKQWSCSHMPTEGRRLWRQPLNDIDKHRRRRRHRCRLRCRHKLMNGQRESKGATCWK